ncbi:hybrid sensor histidine kinase/response regulator transcription factor [Sphingobacteruim zhuxiongii]|nr:MULTISPECIES: two-component regulator propeller domain-containing protein [unclassified Sphingobacterium]
MRRILCAMLFSCFLISMHFVNAQSQQARFFHLSTKDGLSQSTIFSILQDHQDFIWIGTRDGLNRYDASKFRIYRTALSDTSSLTDSYITMLFEDSKKRLWVGTALGLNLYHRDTDDFQRIPINDKSATQPLIYGITEDKQGNIWISSNQGLFRILGNADSFDIQLAFNGRNISNQSFPNNAGNIQHVYQDAKSRLWVSTNGGLYVFSAGGKTGLNKLLYSFQEKANQLNQEEVRFVYEMKPGLFWIGTKEGGINVFDESKKSFSYLTTKSSLPTGSSISSNDVRSLIKDKQGGYWIGTINGLNYYEEGKGFVHYLKKETDINSLSDNSIRPVFQDRRGSIWIGTYYGGVCVFDRHLPVFQHYSKDGRIASLSYNVVSSIAQDSKGGFWVGTEGGGLDYLDQSKKVQKHFKHIQHQASSLSNNHVKNIFIDSKSNVWIGTYTGGINLLRSDGQGFDHIKNDPSDPSSLSSNNVYSINEDKGGNLWIGTYGGGLNLKKAGTKGYFEQYIPGKKAPYALSSDMVRKVFIDSRQNIWVGTENGLNVRWAGNEHFDVFFPKTDDLNSISGSIILSIFEDSKRRLWIGTSKEGLNEFDYKTKTFKRYTQKDGLPGNNIVGILEDANKLWISTNNGICSFSPERKVFTSFNTKDGLLGNEFSIGAAYKSQEGEMLFGGTHGITSFQPNQIASSSYQPKVVFTDLRIHNQPVEPMPGGILTHQLVVNPNLQLPYNKNTFSIYFATLNYVTPEKNKYAYKLEGLEEEWNYVSIPTATYTNLSPGKYTLLIKGASNDAIWSEEVNRLELTILPPFWLTWWAITIYVLFGIAVFYMIISFIKSKSELKYQLELMNLATSHERKVAEMKANFFTKVSHELRTPLMLILSPLQQLLTNNTEQETHKQTLQLMKKNAQRLLQLVNELLDVRKNELGLLKLQVSSNDLYAAITDVLESFKTDFLNKHIAIKIERDEHLPSVWVDPIQFEKVCFNVISNALRFSPEQAEIKVEIRKHEATQKYNKGFLQLCITDYGPGIPAQELETVFELFYQGDQNLSSKKYSSGIGLSLAKDIMELHHGDIFVKSQNEKEGKPSFTTFIIRIPIGNDHFRLEEITQEKVDEKSSNFETSSAIPLLFNTPVEGAEKNMPSQVDAKERKLVLLVDDNEEILQFLYQQLQKNYQVILARDGEEAWELTSEQLPDIVISDVMMPKIDGVSLAKMMKANAATSHIPVILLTALSSTEDIKSGMYAGSDDYLTKPVNIEILALKIQNILYTQHSFRKHFIREYLLKDSPTDNKQEHEEMSFLAQLVQFIEEHLAEEELNVMQLTTHFGMSRPVLYRKVKQLTGLSIIELINAIRLRTAAKLLGSGQLTISEVAYAVGFSDPKWFSKTFKAFYGVTPTQFINLDVEEKVKIISVSKF